MAGGSQSVGSTALLSAKVACGSLRANNGKLNVRWHVKQGAIAMQQLWHSTAKTVLLKEFSYV
jgi:hypothetical protein